MGIWTADHAFLDSLAREYAFEPPREHGLDTVAAIRAMREGRPKVFFALGGNFLSATPDTEYTAAALRRARLTVHVSTKLNRAHLVAGRQALILPCLGRTERDVQAGARSRHCENSMGSSVSRGTSGRVPDLLSEWRSSRGWPRRRAGAEQGRLGGVWPALLSLRAGVERTIPGFEDYNGRVREPGGFYLPNLARARDFRTASGKAEFTVHELPQNELAPGQFLMMTIRSHDQFNTTIHRPHDRYRGASGERRVAFLNPEDVPRRASPRATAISSPLRG